MPLFKLQFPINLPAFFRKNFLLLLILLIGAYLRFSNLGTASYWFDEAGVANSASQPSLSHALEIAHNHVSAMPLDYVIAWIFGRISVEEGFLRLPEALWGVAGIWSVYFFTKKILNKKFALFVSVMVALAPTHIYISQDLRFYSPFFFFYWLLCGLLLHVKDEPTWRNWLKVIIVAIIGGYFCIFTILAFLLAPGLYILSKKDPVFRKQLLKRFFISISIIGLTVLPGFLYFGMESPMDYGIGWRVIAQPIIAAGWLPISATLPGFLLGFTLFLLSIIGLVLALRSRTKYLINLVIVACIQYILISVAVILSGYFIAWRQYFFTLPVTFILVGFTIEMFSYNKKPIIPLAKGNLNNFQSMNRGLANLLIIFLCILCIFTYFENKNYKKSTAREISNQLHNLWQPGDRIIAIPRYTPLLYQFYLEQILQDHRFSDQIEGMDWKNVDNQFQQSGRV